MRKIIPPAWIAIASLAFVSVSRAELPNIVLILTDDAGYSDLGCYGGEIDTPNLDRLAADGMRFSACYNQSRCTPTRASLLTGHYAHTVGMGELAGWGYSTPLPAYQEQADLNFPMIQELLKNKDYHTIMTGKWHLGGAPIDQPGGPTSAEWKRMFTEREWSEQARQDAFDALPPQRGFDYFFGVPGACADNFGADAPYIGGKHHRQWDYRYWEGNALRKIEEEGWYSTTAHTSHAMEQVRQAKQEDKPFFLYLSYQAPHMPVQAPEPVVEKYRKLYRAGIPELQKKRAEHLAEEGLVPPGTRFRRSVKPLNDEQLEAYATHAAMIDVVDQNVGRLVDELKELGMFENTLILYMSDNGAAGPSGFFFNAPFHGMKAMLYEGGVRSPLIVHWPDGPVADGAISHAPVSVMDILPTLLEITGIPYPGEFRGRKTLAPVGRNILPAFKGEPVEPVTLHWNLYNQQAVMDQGKWKLVVNGGLRGYDDPNWNPDPPIVELFDLQTDPTETKNIAKQNPEVVERLMAKQREWEEQHNVLPHREVAPLQRRFNAGKK